MLAPFCVTLGVIFGAAGLAKLADPGGTTEALTNFGVPSRLVRSGRVVLPVAEMVVATALFIPRSAAAGAAAAAGLLVAFSIAVAVRLARGEHPPCNCFGGSGASSIGVGTLVRNGVLISLALVIALMGWGHADRLGWGGLASNAREWLALTVVAALAFAVALCGWLILELMRRHGELLLRVDELEGLVGIGDAEQAMGLRVGTTAPDFTLPTVHGESISLETLLAERKPLLLLFTSRGCAPCDALMPDVALWQREMAGVLTVAMITRGDPEQSRSVAARHGLANVLMQIDHEVADAYQSPGTPSAVVIGGDGTIRSQMAAGVGVIRALVADALGIAEEPATASDELVHPNEAIHSNRDLDKMELEGQR